MKRINNLIAISAFSFLVLCLPSIASAQYGGQNDPYGRNGGYNNGGYGNGQYGDMRSIVGNLKNHASLFQRQLDRDLDNSRYNGTRQEDQINQLAKDFKNAVNKLKSNNDKQSNEVSRVLNLGSQLDRTIGRDRIGSSANTIWYEVRQDLNALSSMTGNYNRNNRNNRGNQNGRNGNGRNNTPSWWPF